MIQIEFIGTAGGSASKDRNFPCIAITVDKQVTLLDVGEGTSTNLLKRKYDLSAIKYCIISHMHVDHFLGLHSLLFKKWLINPDSPTNIYLPIDGKIALKGAFTCMADNLRNNLQLDIQEISPNTEIKLDSGLTLSAIEVPHVIPQNIKLRAYAIKLKSKNQSVVYTGDTKGSEELVKFALDTDVLISEATFLNDQFELAQEVGHLTAGQAGILAQKARVHNLIVTHREPGPEFNQLYTQQIREHYQGNLQLAEDNLVINI